jgi:hypothetical protein
VPGRRAAAGAGSTRPAGERTGTRASPGRNRPGRRTLMTHEHHGFNLGSRRPGARPVHEPGQEDAGIQVEAVGLARYVQHPSAGVPAIRERHGPELPGQQPGDRLRLERVPDPPGHPPIVHRSERMPALEPTTRPQVSTYASMRE